MRRSICLCILLLLVICAWSFGPATQEAKALKIITLTSPMDSTKQTEPLPTFAWQVSGGTTQEVITRFHIKLADNPWLTDPIWEDSDVAAGARSMDYPGTPGLAEWTAYYWAMRAEIDTGQVYWQDFTPASVFFYTTATLFSIRADGSGDLPTIQEAIVWAAAGDTVWVDQGTYYENLRIYKNDLLVASNYLFDFDGDTATINATIIDGSNSTRGSDFGSVIYFSPGVDSSCTVRGFTIRGGAGSKITVGLETRTVGGGIFCDAGSTPTIAYNVITGNQVQHDGGAIYINSAAPNIFHNVIANNVAVEGAGGAIQCRFSIEVEASPSLKQGKDEGGTSQKAAVGSRRNADETKIENSLNPRDGTEVASAQNNPPVPVCENDPIYGDTIVGFQPGTTGPGNFYNVRLYACDSYDPDSATGDKVKYFDWECIEHTVISATGLQTLPCGAINVKRYLCDNDKVRLQFGGLYKLYLTVEDNFGLQSDGYDSLFISVQLAPVADAGRDTVVRPEKIAYLYGRALDMNPDQRDSMQFTWRWIELPPVTEPVIRPSPTEDTVNFTVPVSGIYRLALTVDDGFGISEKDDEVVVVANQAPQATVINIDHAFEGDTVYLDGSGSYDMDSTIFQHPDSAHGGPLEFSWSVKSYPAGAQMPVILDASQPVAKFVPYGTGTFTFRLLVNDTMSVFQPEDSTKSGRDTLANVAFLDVVVDSTYAYPLIQGNLIYGNSAGTKGGAIDCNGSSPDIFSNVFYKNQSELSGGAICARNLSSPQIKRNVFFGNISGNSTGGAIANLGALTAPSATRGFRKNMSIQENDFWDNRGGTLYQASGDISANIDTFPRFYDPDFGDFRYECDSPCLPDIGKLVFFPECVSADRLNTVALSLFQNPVATAAAHFIINTDVPLKSYPVGYVTIGGNAPSPIYFSPVASKTYRGSFVFTASGSADVSLFASSLLERDTVVVSTMSVQLIGAGKTGKLVSADGKLGVLFADGSVKEEVYATCISVSKDSRYNFDGDPETEAFGDPYQLGPSISFDKDLTVSFSLAHYDLEGKDKTLFSIYRYEDAGWTRLESYPDGDRISAEAKTLGVFRLIYDPNAKPFTNIPNTYRLFHNYPNPFNPETQIKYDLPLSGNVTLSVYNVLGQKVRALVDGMQEAGHRSVTWDGRDDAGREVASGIYFYKIKAEDYQMTMKMVLLK
ncbi:MAG: T9SS type A sorting domain-containing protein [Candidatus Zixiibacteriota bacterium]|nr:MAG: T9SS type A sorting domain-containing protein [candidate division Zixibacteria bacterium]